MSLFFLENWKKNSLFWRTGNNYGGREAAAFLKRSQLGTAAENNYGQRPPFYYWTAGKNYGREAAAILKWYNDNLDYGREAVVFFNLETDSNILWFTFGQLETGNWKLETTKAAKRPPS